jgi:DNA-binding LacI/PurR family transcriptional regulator
MADKKAVTISDVAARAGVSMMTVSNVLSNNQARRRHVSEETRARVLEAIEQMKYRPNANARSLRRRRTNIIGFYAGHGYINPENAFLAAILGGLQEGCDAHRKDLLIHGTFRGKEVADIYLELADGRIDGLVLYSPTNDPLVELLAESSLPVVAIADAVPILPSVVVDDAAGAHLQAEYLAQRGHRRIAYHSSARFQVSAERRLAAFRDAAAASGLEVLEYPSAHARNEAHVSEDVVRWLDAPPGERPTAAVCWNDVAAYDLLYHCLKRGLRVPEDVAILGFDGVIPSRGLGRRLTTIRAPWASVAQTAVALLVQEIEGGTVAQETTLPVELVLGDTA